MNIKYFIPEFKKQFEVNYICIQMFRFIAQINIYKNKLYYSYTNNDFSKYLLDKYSTRITVYDIILYQRLFGSISTCIKKYLKFNFFIISSI